MKQFFNVLSFELSNYFKNKGYLITINNRTFFTINI